MHFFIQYVKQRKMLIVAFFLCSFIFFCTFALYQFPLEAVLYPCGLCLLLVILLLAFDIRKEKKKREKLCSLLNLSAELMMDFPAADTMEAEEYQKIIRLLCKQQEELLTEKNLRYSELMEYYMVWAHQIKTPIASMRLHLQNEDTELSRQLTEDLQRIEQYVEMVLTFLRLDTDSTDYVFRKQPLDEIVRGAVKKFSMQFIRKKLRLVYKPLEFSVVTDEKWLGFVIEQVLSNALKYTKEGSIKIYAEEGNKLYISDTGIGIAPEDLPRIFENGYTGYNGRSDKRASGIGLYLCRRICTNLGHAISISSEPDQGTVVCIEFEKKTLEVE